MPSKHLGIRVSPMGPHFAPKFVTHKGREIGRIERTPNGFHKAVITTRTGHLPLSVHRTHSAALHEIRMHAIRPPATISPKLKRPGASIFRLRKHPTQSLGV